MAVYPTALDQTTHPGPHYTASGRTGWSVPPVPADSYRAGQVYNYYPDLFWRMDETTGTMAADSGLVPPNDGTYRQGGVTLGQPGAIAAPPAGPGFDGVNDTWCRPTPSSNPTVYSEEVWFNTDHAGGKLIGFGTNATGNSGGYDRHVWMLNDGRLRFGTWTGQTNIAESTATYNDGAWHHMVATQGQDGMKLYVDGTLVGHQPADRRPGLHRLLARRR